LSSKQTVPWGTRESTPVERTRTWRSTPSSTKQESPDFSRGECQYRAIFANTLHDMILEIFPAHGIDYLDEEYFDEMITDITKKHFYQTIAEFRKQTGQSSVPRIRMRW